MIEEKKILSLLQITVPPDTALTVTAEVKILEMLGIVSSPELVKATAIAIGMIPANTPATLHGLIVLLGNLVKHHPKSTKTHHDELATLIKNFNEVPDVPLTYGSFLVMCESLIKAIHAHRKTPVSSVKSNKPKKKKATKAQ